MRFRLTESGAIYASSIRVKTVQEIREAGLNVHVEYNLKKTDPAYYRRVYIDLDTIEDIMKLRHVAGYGLIIDPSCYVLNDDKEDEIEIYCTSREVWDGGEWYN